MGETAEKYPVKETVKYLRTLYPKMCVQGYTGFMVCLYTRVDETNVEDKKYSLPKSKGGNGVECFIAAGVGLPNVPKVIYHIYGDWTVGKNGKKQLSVSKSEVAQLKSKYGVINYLTTFNGMGKKTAEKIWRTFGVNTLDILDTDIDRIMEVPKLSESKFLMFKNDYILRAGCKNFTKLCIPFGITSFQIQRFYEYFGDETAAMDAFKNNPYKLCAISGVGFKTADAIATRQRLNPKMPERIKEAALYVLTEYGVCGNTCISGKILCEAVCKVCNFPIEKETRNIILEPIKKLVDDGVIVKFDDMFFKKDVDYIEGVLAGRVCRALKHSPSTIITNIDDELINIQRKLKLSFAAQQVNAVKMALGNDTSFCVITGGPGTGKTLIQRAILEIFQKQNPNAKILCCSPTGKAARRMTESTGFPAQTVHSALHLAANEMGDFSDPTELDDDLIVVDEVSMLDTFIAASLLDSVKNGCRVVFVGDCDQLPSVGAGCVLADLLDSDKVPFVKLNAVFRQSKESLIAVNAQAINHGNLELRYGDDFQFIPCSDPKKSVDILVEEYIKAIDEQGLDGVALLSPFRKSTETGVTALNVLLQSKINPPDASKAEVMFYDKTYRVGDRVMQTKNFKNVANGDIGIITSISEESEDGVKEIFITVEYADAELRYQKSELKMLDLAYCTTVHKSQGSEYHTVILTLQMVHKRMLNRPLIYTAITRGKKKIIIVGEKQAIKTAIDTNDVQKRFTRLKERILSKFE